MHYIIEFSYVLPNISALYTQSGWYRQTPLPQRLCTRWDAQVVEDEEHFLFHCPQYHQLRQTICEGLLADIVDIKSLFDSDTAIKKLSRYIVDSLKLGRH